MRRRGRVACEVGGAGRELEVQRRGRVAGEVEMQGDRGRVAGEVQGES